MERRLSFSQKLFFGFGHVLNDMCASLWFNYLLIYLHSVLLFTNVMAGTLLLIGQVADALSTPIVGLESDRASCSKCYPRRKSWHLFGYLMTLCSFVFIFNPCLVCTKYTSEWAKFVYFAPIIIIFQIGWASTQISHLALIPDLTSCEHQRVELTSIRYGFTVCSNFVVFGSAWLLLTYLPLGPNVGPIHSNKTGNGSLFPVEVSRLSPIDIPVFRYLALMLVAFGSIFTIGFHLGVNEPPSQNNNAVEGEENFYAGDGENADENGVDRYHSEISNEETNDDIPPSDESSMPLIPSSSIRRPMKSKDWFREPIFFVVAGIYVCVRLITNVSQVYMSLYINDTLMIDKIHVALVPLSIYAVSLATSLIQKKMNKYLGRKLTLFIGFVLTLGYCISIFFIKRPPSLAHLYCTALLLGVSTSILMVGSLSLTADMIGEEKSTSAFVYGVMSFGDKLCNGVAVEIIQLIHPCVRCCVQCVWFYRTIEVFVIGGVAVVGLVLLLISLFRETTDLSFYRDQRNCVSIQRKGREYGATSSTEGYLSDGTHSHQQ